MTSSLNTLRWAGNPGHYEVYYLTLTDPVTGVGIWIRYTLLAPFTQPATCALWFLAMDPRPDRRRPLGGKQTFPIGALRHDVDPFAVQIEDARLSDSGAWGGFSEFSWDLRWSPSARGRQHVHPLLQRAGVAQTILVLPHGDIAIDGTVTIAGERIELSGTPGGQAHLWGSKHARRWAWVHCNDFARADGSSARDTLVDAVSVYVSRLGRDFGPSTPVVGRVAGAEFSSVSPLRVVRNQSKFSPAGWRFEAAGRARKLIAEVRAPRDLLAGVTYEDPDGEKAYCYNTEAASLRLRVLDRAGRRGWSERETLVCAGRAHFEYAQRTPLADVELLT